jgi:hypothetical protein
MVEEKRKDARHYLPVVILAPTLSEMPLVPEDISEGGFRVLTNEEPPHEERFECSIQIGGQMFDSCTASVIWSYNNGNGTWYAGIAIEELHEEKDVFSLTLEEAQKKSP